MLYELRVYEVMPGRMGDLVARFESMNVPLFARHGIRAVGYWTTAIGEGTEFTYMLAWDSMQERETRWGAFVADPQMRQAIVDSERDGPIVARHRNQIMQPTAYSPRA